MVSHYIGTNLRNRGKYALKRPSIKFSGLPFALRELRKDYLNRSNFDPLSPEFQFLHDLFFDTSKVSYYRDLSKRIHIWQRVLRTKKYFEKSVSPRKFLKKAFEPLWLPNYSESLPRGNDNRRRRKFSKKARMRNRKELRHIVSDYIASIIGSSGRVDRVHISKHIEDLQMELNTARARPDSAKIFSPRSSGKLNKRFKNEFVYQLANLFRFKRWWIKEEKDFRSWKELGQFIEAIQGHLIPPTVFTPAELDAQKLRKMYDKAKAENTRLNSTVKHIVHKPL